ncbi:MAG: FliH/SctL family protein [Planctomycetota bacterium]
MSSDRPALHFNRPLGAVKTRRGGGGRRPADRVSSVDQLQLAERRRRLETAQQELSRREEALARREIELAEQTTVLDGRLEELAALISSVQEGKMEMLEANEEEIVSFSLSITEKVLQYEIENGRYRIGEVVRSTLRAVRDRGALVVRVNPRDHELTRAAVERLAQTYGTTRIRTVPDESIPLASCCIETDSGKIFSEIPGRLERIERSLLRKNGDSDGV